MLRKEYSAGAVSTSFWFMEFRKEVELLSQGKTFEEIKKLCKEENIFGASTPYRSEQIYNKVTARIKTLGDTFYQIFTDSDVSTQKLFVLVSIMAYDSLFFDFLYEIIREKIILGSNEYSDIELKVFFKNKQLQSKKMSSWTDETFARLGRIYKTFLYEAGITNKSKDVRKIYRPILDIEFEKWLKDNDMGQIVDALTGVR
jgi:hypothetical protein